MLEKMPLMVSGMKRMADKVHSRAEALGRMWNIDEYNEKSLLSEKINPQVPEHMIDWRNYEEEE